MAKRKFKFIRPSLDIRRLWDEISKEATPNELNIIGYKALLLAIERQSWKNGKRSPKRGKQEDE